MPKFKVLEGLHDGGGGVFYGKGEVFESEHPLDEMFANKFKRMGGKTRTSRDHDDLPDTGGGTKVMDSKTALQRKVAKEAKKGPGPGQTEEEFTDLSAEAKMKGGKKGKTVLTKRKFANDYPETVDEVDDEFEEDDEEEGDEDAADESESEEATPSEDEGEAEESGEDAEEEAVEEKPAPKKAGMKKKPKRK